MAGNLRPFLFLATASFRGGRGFVYGIRFDLVQASAG
jgi:hypothetical protein